MVFKSGFMMSAKHAKNIAPQQIELLYKVRQRKTCVGLYLSWIWAPEWRKDMYPRVRYIPCFGKVRLL